MEQEKKPGMEQIFIELFHRRTNDIPSYRIPLENIICIEPATLVAGEYDDYCRGTRSVCSYHQNTIEKNTVRTYLAIDNSTRITFTDDYGERHFLYVNTEYKDVISAINRVIDAFNDSSQGMNYSYRAEHCNVQFNIIY